MAGKLEFLGESEGRKYFFDLRETVAAKDGKTKIPNPTFRKLVWKIPDIREAIRAEEGYVICSCDYSQVEVRIMAFLSQDPGLIKAINSGQDIHCYFSVDIYGQELNFDYSVIKAATKGDDCEFHPRHDELKFIRSGVKTTVFGTPYGASPAKIAAMTGMTEDQAADFQSRYFRKYPKLKEWLDNVGRNALRYGFSTSPRGRKRFYVMPNQQDPEREKILSQIKRWAGNHPIQCVAAGTRIFEKSLGYVPIETQVGKVVTIWDGHRWATAAVQGGRKKELLKMELHGGYFIEPSHEHQFSVLTPKNKRLWKSPGHLGSKNDRVELTEAVPKWHLAVTIPPAPDSKSNNHNDLTITSMTSMTDLGEFLGRLASDGGYRLPTKSMGGLVRLLCAEHEISIMPRLQELAALLGKFSVDTETKDKRSKKDEPYAPMHRLVLCSSSLARQLHRIRVKRQIPEFVWADYDLLRAYLRGLFDGDGTVNQDGAVLTFGGGLRHLGWARQVQQALLLLGIRSKTYPYDYESGGRVNVRVQKYDMPQFAKLVGFMNPEKQTAAEQVVGDPCKGTACYGRGHALKSLEYTGEEVEMFDVVLSETGQFMGNGLVTHNSGNVDMLKPAMKRIYDAFQARGWKYEDARILFVVHDEIVCTCRRELAQEVRLIIAQSMRDAFYNVIDPSMLSGFERKDANREAVFGTLSVDEVEVDVLWKKG